MLSVYKYKVNGHMSDYQDIYNNDFMILLFV